MRNVKRYIQKNSTLAEIVIFLIGLVLVSFVKQGGILSNIGSSIIASSIVIFMTDVLIGKESNESVVQWGLEAVYKTRGEMNSNCDEYLKKAKKLDIIAFGLKSWRDSQQAQIDRILQLGGSIRIITMKPGCASLKARERDEFETENGISHSIEQLIEWAKSINNNGFKGKIEVRYHDHLPLDFLFIMDNRVFTGPYEYGKGSQQTLSFEYSNTCSAYEYYKSYFNDLWANEEFCQDALKD